MADRRSSTNTQKQRIKLVLIPVLGIVLISFLFSQNDKRLETIPGVTPQATATPTKPTFHAKQSNVDWPSASLDQVLRHNPFAAPPALTHLMKPSTSPGPIATVKTLAVTNEDLTEELRSAMKGKKLHGLIQTSRGFIALVGDDVVREGDLIGERVRVKSIQSKGVELELIPGG